MSSTRSRRPPTQTLVRRLKRLREEFGAEAEAQKVELLRALRGRRCTSVADLLSLHESLCFLRAYPGSHAGRELVLELVAEFSSRSDVRRLQGSLDAEGVAGVPIRSPFYWPTLRWLVRRWPDRLRIDWDEWSDPGAVESMLSLLVPYTETLGIYEADLTLREWIDCMRHPDETDAAFLVRRFESLRLGPFWSEFLFDRLGIPCILDPGPGTPSRTEAALSGIRPVLRKTVRRSERPDLAAEIRRGPPSIRPVSRRRGTEIQDLARAAMLSRARDLDAIVYGNPSDAYVVEDEPGLHFVGFGMEPSRRYVLEGTYLWLILQNGVPVSYMQGSGAFDWAEVNYNVFPPFRGRDSARLYGRSLAVLHAVMGIETFLVDPYQLGDENDEALASGAWWFYRKLGFEPVDPATAERARHEIRLCQRRPSHRTSRGTLRELARSPMRLCLSRNPSPFSRELVAPLGVAVSRMLGERFGSHREEGMKVCSDEVAAELGGGSDPRAGMHREERLAFDRWAPLVSSLPGRTRWTPTERLALIDVLRAKGGRRESTYLRLLARHRRLAQALAQLASREVAAR